MVEAQEKPFPGMPKDETDIMNLTFLEAVMKHPLNTRFKEVFVAADKKVEGLETTPLKGVYIITGEDCV